ncbi:MAG TPA: PH domain-containing protein [Longimicrobiales bacterium]
MSTPSDARAAPAAAPARRLHRSTLLFEALRIGRAFVVPALLAALGAADDGPGRTTAVGLGVLAVPALLAAIAKYLGLRYRLTTEELVIDSGVLSRRHRVIPLRRIQNIDVRQSWLQRLASVAELRIETAGGERTEAVLSTLAWTDAEALRAELLGRRAALGHAGMEIREAAPPAETLARLSPADLALAGATANEAGLAAAGLLGLLQLVEDLPVQVPLPGVDPSALIPSPPAVGIAIVVAALLALSLLAGWLLSIIGAVIGYHGFTLERAGDELRKRYGLLGRREGSMPIRRVQTIRVEESLLRRPFGLAALKIETAGAGPGQRPRAGAEAFLPLARRRDVPRLAGAVFNDLDYATLRFHPVHPRARRRRFLRYSAPLILIAGVTALATRPAALLLLLLVPLLFLIAHKQYRHMGYALAPGYAATRAGFFNRITWIIPDRKIQTLHIHETPFQRRHGLATVIIDTAGGGRSIASIPDLPREEARLLLDRLTTRATRTAASSPIPT